MKKLLLLILVLLSLGALAVPADYVVYYVKGAVTKKGGQRALRRGDSLFVQDVVQLPQGAELYLVCRDYSMLQLKKSGSYTLREAAPCPGKQQALTASYFRYVWEELRSHHGAPEQNPRHYMRNKGAVSRGDCPMVRTALYADTIYANGGDLNLYWTSAIPAPFLTFYPDEHDAVPVKQIPLKTGKPVRLKDLLANAGEGAVAYWYITPKKAGGCNRNYLQVLPAADYRARINRLLAAVVPTTTAETALMKAFLLEENHFPVEALRYYAEAFRLDPTNPRTTAALKHYHEIN